jgi:secreted PhoX family phosphatase
MTQASNPSRRQTLKFLAGVPMLPMSGLAASSLLTACGGGGGDGNSTTPPSVSFVSAKFGEMPAPTSIADRATTHVASTLTITLSDNSTQKFNLAYEPFFLTGTQVPDGNGGTTLAGAYYDINNAPIMDTTVPARPRQFFSDSPDGTSLLTVPNASVPGVTGNHVFAVVQFEYTTWAQDGSTNMYGKLPSPIAILTLDQNPTTGKLKLVKYHNVDTSGVKGLWITCGASLSPWGTHLSSEEYEPDAFAARSANYMNDFSLNLHGNAATANPYDYGHLPEVTVKPDGTGSIKKHYCLGRISHELVQVMPDERTVLMGDDATNSAYFMFVADTARDLSAGTLYAAQVGIAADPGTAYPFSLSTTANAAPMKWIKLGHATSAEIKALVDGGIQATQIMQVSSVDPTIADPTATGYTRVKANGKIEWIKLQTGMEKAAAFLETHRYAALVGASTCFTKMEGTTVNAKDKIAYSALQNVQASMVTGNALSKPEVQVAQVNAGAVMALNLRGAQIDTTATAINSEWVPVDIKALLVGEDISADSLGNTANPNKIGNPDNLKFSEKLRTLFIGEDSGQHTNNFLWAYNVDTPNAPPVRILSVPAGGESTGLHAVDEINGWTYIMSNFQHAGDSSYVRGNTALNNAVKVNYNDKYAAAVGYLTATSTSIKLNKL